MSARYSNAGHLGGQAEHLKVALALAEAELRQLRALQSTLRRQEGAFTALCHTCWALLPPEQQRQVDRMVDQFYGIPTTM